MKVSFRLITVSLIFGFSTLQGQVTLINHYEVENPEKIGTFQNITFREGGFSSLKYIAGTNGKEFWTVTDRGVNIEAKFANAMATPSEKYPICTPTYDKIYAFPDYAPKILRLKIEGRKIKIVQSITIKRPNRTNATGLLNPAGLGSTEIEKASTNIVSHCSDFDRYVAIKDIWGIDSEGLDVDKDGNFWLCEEGGPTIWKVGPDGVVLKRYTPYGQNPQSQDVFIDPCFSFRRNNRGFEGITVTPNGKVYAIIQSPLYYKNVSDRAGDGELAASQIHRILEIDPKTDATKMYAYVNDGSKAGIKPKDMKVGDLRAINNTTFLTIEQGSGKSGNDVKRVYIIDLANATEVQSGLAYGGKTLEELKTLSGLVNYGIRAVDKKMLFDLFEKGWPKALEKAEGIAIIDKSTIAICNDNDYGQKSVNEDGRATETNIKSSVYIFNLQGEEILKSYVE